MKNSGEVNIGENAVNRIPTDNSEKTMSCSPNMEDMTRPLCVLQNELKNDLKSNDSFLNKIDKSKSKNPSKGIKH